MAYRLAEAKRDVCVLERGKKWPPGSFARTPYQFSRNEWDPSKGLHGLFDVWSFKGLGALVSSGLGGGSLIYANVLLRKPERWFEEAPPDGLVWPITRAELDPHYDAVEDILKPELYPPHLQEKTPKTQAFLAAAGALGLEPEPAPLAVTFSSPDEELGSPFDEPHENIHNAQRYRCRLVGECDAGCNFGSKNSLDFTYLSAAQQHGAEIRCRHEVKAFEPVAGGFRVVVRDYSAVEDGAKDSSGAVDSVIFAKKLILSAGALGTPYLLLKNWKSLEVPPNPGLGTRFSANGDFLAFASRCRPLIEPSIGPVVTSYVQVADQLDEGGGDGRGHYIQDGGYPVFLAWVAQTAALPRIAWMEKRLALSLAWKWMTGHRERNLSAELSQLFGSPGLTAGTMTMLGMGREPVQGKMSLTGKELLDIDWSFDEARDYFDHMGKNGTMAAIARQLGGHFHDNVLRKLNAIVTAHPVGGCPMGETPKEGVVSPITGEVYGVPGLHVADGSVMPGPVGSNPSFTIAAVANRFAEAILGEKAGQPST